MLQLFRHQTAICVLHQFMGFGPQQPASSASLETYVESSRTTLARLVAFATTTVVYLREDGADTVGGHRQKFNHETFKPYVANPYGQIIEKLGISYRTRLLKIWKFPHLAFVAVCHRHQLYTLLRSSR